MGGEVLLAAIGKGRVERYMGQMEWPAHRAWLDNRELSLCLVLAQRTVRRKPGYRGCFFLRRTIVIMVRRAGFQERVQTEAAERYRPIEGQ